MILTLKLSIRHLVLHNGACVRKERYVKTLSASVILRPSAFAVISTQFKDFNDKTSN